MDKLPVEILNRVFDKLHFSQKARCALVCRQWATLIHSYNLLYDLTIEHSSRHKPTIFDAWEKRIIEQPRWGKQVRQLLLIECLSKKEDVIILPTLFPFVRKLVIRQNSRSDVMFDTSQSNQFDLWHNRLESILEVASHLLTYRMLCTGVFSQLQSITIAYDESTNVSSTQLFEKFKHTPALKYLTLAGFTLNFTLLELLHKNTDNLESLTIEETAFFDEPLPHIVQPIKSLHTLKILFDEFTVNRINLWKRYILSKYPNVTKLVFNAASFDVNSGENLSHTHILNPILQKFSPRLKTLGVMSEPFEPEWLRILDKKGAKLHTLHMNANWDPHTIDALLPFHQFQNLTTLSITLMCATDFSWLKSTVHLEKLKLDYILEDGHEDIPIILLNQLLASCPTTLNKLVIVHGHVTTGTPVINTHSNIKSLKIKHGLTDELAMAFVSEYCSQLHTLSLVYSSMETWTVNLPKHHISYFEVSTPHNKTNIKVTTNDGSRIYVPNHRFTKVKRSMMKDTVALTAFSILKSTVTNMVEKDNDAKTTIHISCQSLQNLFVNDHCAY